MIVEYKSLLEKVLSYWPETIACNNAVLTGNDGLKWELLHQTYDKIELNLLENNDDGEFLDSLSWCVVVGLGAFCRTIYKEKGECDFIALKDIDYDVVKKHFIETIEDDDWQEYLQENDIKIQF